MDKYSEIRVPISCDNPSIMRDENKCVLCGKCKDVCKKKIGVAGYWTYDSEDIVCINCGQCANVCPMNSIVEKNDVENFLHAVDRKDKKVVVCIAPAVRVSLGEMFDMQVGEFVVGKIVKALKLLGVDYVFDVTYGADLTIMEEASELLDRIKKDSDMPMFTSCCPAWVKFVETFYPERIKNLSSCKSPISMQSSIIKNYFAKKENLRSEDLFVVALTPCVAKKFEIMRPELGGSYGQDTDLVLSAREFGNLLKDKGIDLKNLEEEPFDEAFPTGSGGGVIFGSSGGVMEAAVRTAYYFSTGKNPPEKLLEFAELRGNKGIKTATVNLCGKDLNLCVVSGTYNAREVLQDLNNIDFLEVMACPNGCVGGGGQPKQFDNDEAVEKRGQKLFDCDKNSKIKSSFETEQMKRLYEEFLLSPLSETAKKYLHTSYQKR